MLKSLDLRGALKMIKKKKQNTKRKSVKKKQREERKKKKFDRRVRESDREDTWYHVEGNYNTYSRL